MLISSEFTTLTPNHTQMGASECIWWVVDVRVLTVCVQLSLDVLLVDFWFAGLTAAECRCSFLHSFRKDSIEITSLRFSLCKFVAIPCKHRIVWKAEFN